MRKLYYQPFSPQIAVCVTAMHEDEWQAMSLLSVTAHYACTTQQGTAGKVHKRVYDLQVINLHGLRPKQEIKRGSSSQAWNCTTERTQKATTEFRIKHKEVLEETAICGSVDYAAALESLDTQPEDISES